MSPEPTKEFATRCADLYKRHDMPLIAGVLGVTPVEVSRSLRKARVAMEVQPHELSFIVEKIDAMPERAIMEYLGLSGSQFDQILRRYKIRKQLKTERMTLDGCIAKTRWLMETRLKWPIDDRLPRLITNKHFTDNGLYPAVAFATESKAKCSTARHFSACAFLVDQTYPGHFKPWQFRHSKQNRYFIGKGGSRNFLSALMWLTETKLGITAAALPYAMNSHGFLNTRTLRDFGLGPNWWRQIWPSKPAMLEAFAKHAGIVPAGPVDQTSARGRALLKSEGVDPGYCAVPGCPISGAENIEVHHIVQRASRVVGSFDLHAIDNLVPLCRHHHGVAGRIRPPPAFLRSPPTLRPWLIERLVATSPVSAVGEPGVGT